MGAGRLRAVCRGWRAIAAASRLCAGTVRAAADLGISVADDFLLQLGELVAPALGNPRPYGSVAPVHPHDLADLHRSNVRVRIIGEREDLDRDIFLLLQEAKI